jgi:sirohydrochlorin ferrochelatase
VSTTGWLPIAVRQARLGLEAEAAFVDVQPPAVADVVRALADAGRRSVVVPLLLSAGFHVHVDVGRAVRASGGSAVAAAALGPDVRLAALLHDRLVGVGARAGDAVVLAAAGSSDPRAAADVGVVRDALAARWDGPVVTGFGASAAPSVPEAVAQARVTRGRVAVAAYLLAPGQFHERLARAGADLVTPPLLAGSIDDRLVSLVLDRYDEAVVTR